MLRIQAVSLHELRRSTALAETVFAVHEFHGSGKLAGKERRHGFNYWYAYGTYDVHTNFTYSFQDSAYRNKAREEGLKKELEKHPELASIIVRP